MIFTYSVVRLIEIGLFWLNTDRIFKKWIESLDWHFSMQPDQIPICIFCQSLVLLYLLDWISKVLTFLQPTFFPSGTCNAGAFLWWPTPSLPSATAQPSPYRRCPYISCEWHKIYGTLACVWDLTCLNRRNPLSQKWCKRWVWLGRAGGMDVGETECQRDKKYCKGNIYFWDVDAILKVVYLLLHLLFNGWILHHVCPKLFILSIHFYA